jgi:hypothetical protein
MERHRLCVCGVALVGKLSYLAPQPLDLDSRFAHQLVGESRRVLRVHRFKTRYKVVSQ